MRLPSSSFTCARFIKIAAFPWRLVLVSSWIPWTDSRHILSKSFCLKTLTMSTYTFIHITLAVVCCFIQPLLNWKSIDSENLRKHSIGGLNLRQMWAVIRPIRDKWLRKLWQCAWVESVIKQERASTVGDLDIYVGLMSFYKAEPN